MNQTSDVTSDDKLWSLLGYLVPVIALIVLLIEDKRSRPFLKFHAVQSLAFNVAAYVIITILSAITLGIGSILCIAPVAYSIYLAVKSYQGEYVTIPWLTDFIRKQGWVS
jgi:uncharacterized membrane protein